MTLAVARERVALDRWALPLLIAAALSARVFVAVATPLALFPDSRRFLQAVKAVRHRRTQWLVALSDWTAPLPVLLWSPIVGRHGGLEHAVWLHHALGCLTAVLVFVAVRALHGAAAALLVSLPFALSPYLLFAERAFLGESIDLWTVALALALFVGVATGRRPRRWAAGLGVALGIAWLAKSNGALLVAGLALALLMPASVPGPSARRLALRGQCAVLAIGLCFVVAAPWLLYQKRQHGVLQVTPNTQRNRLLYAFEAGLFDLRPELGPNPPIARLLPEALSQEPFAARGQATIALLTQRYGFGAASEGRARRILNAEIARKPAEFSRLVRETTLFLLLDQGRGHDELHDLLLRQWAGRPSPPGFPGARAAARWPNAAALGFLWHADLLSFPALRAAPALALLGLVAAAIRGGANRRWAAQLALPFLLVVAAHALALADNFRFLMPFLPLFALCAVSWTTICTPGGTAEPATPR